jgi:hypothetical protein
MKDGNMLRTAFSFLVCAVAVVCVAGCWNNVDSAQQANPEGSNIPYGAALNNAFTDGVWKTLPGGGKIKQVQFDAKISRELHDYCVGKLTKGPLMDLFTQSCGYLGMLIKNNKVTGDPLINFDTTVYPINADGSVQMDRAGAYLDDADNRKAVLALEDFYIKRYWESGSPVTIVFDVSGIKKAKPSKCSGLHWDYDPKFAGKPDMIVSTVYEYVKPLLLVK